uniref:TIL domain-containing protein n=1 Tax=Panagrellus redivivus TaxID=6233 RepID=A0A7E4W3R0_PANRE
MMQSIFIGISLAVIANIAVAQNSTECKPNEVYTNCGTCENTCETRDQPCTMECRPAGCYCPRDGFVRDGAGNCVPDSTCPSGSPPTNFNPCIGYICPTGQRCIPRRVQCFVPPCYPIPVCVPSDCNNPSEPTPTCQPNEVYTTCGSCESTCDNLHPICTLECRPPGCYCPQGDFVRLANGSCAPAGTCPITVRPITLPTPIP